MIITTATRHVRAVSPFTSLPLMDVHCRRWASQEINPIYLRLQRHEPNVSFDRQCVRSWQQTMYVPHEGYAQWNHYAPYLVQGLKMKEYMGGYFEGTAFHAKPLIYRTVAGTLVRVFVHTHTPVETPPDYAAIEKALEHVFGRFQGRGTSGRSVDGGSSGSNREGRTKVRLDVIELASPLYHAELLAQHVAHQLNKNMSINAIFDRLTKQVTDGTPRRVQEPGAELLEVAGFRLRVTGRPRGEEMAIKKDFIYGSCPKRDAEALMDFGKCDVKLRSGMVGVKAWVHFQRPHLDDELGQRGDLVDEDVFPRLLAVDRDYNADRVAIESIKTEVGNGLWNVQSSVDPLVAPLVTKLRQLHQPDYPQNSRFIW